MGLLLKEGWSTFLPSRIAPNKEGGKLKIHGAGRRMGGRWVGTAVFSEDTVTSFVSTFDIPFPCSLHITCNSAFGENRCLATKNFQVLCCYNLENFISSIFQRWKIQMLKPFFISKILYTFYELGLSFLHIF